MIPLNQYRKSKRSSTVGDLTSLIDVIFLLLIFFLLTSVTHTSSVEESIQASKHSSSTEISEVLYIEITNNNRYKVDGNAYSVEELYGYFEKEDISKESVIAITSAQGALYSQVLSLVSPLVEKGWSNISFVVE